MLLRQLISLQVGKIIAWERETEAERHREREKETGRKQGREGKKETGLEYIQLEKITNAGSESLSCLVFIFIDFILLSVSSLD